MQRKWLGIIGNTAGALFLSVMCAHAATPVLKQVIPLGAGSLDGANSMVIDRDDKVYVLDGVTTETGTKLPRVQKFTTNGVFLKEWVATEAGSGNGADFRLSTDSHGQVYVHGSRSAIYSAEGTYQRPSPVEIRADMVADADDLFYTAGWTWITAFDASGTKEVWHYYMTNYFRPYIYSRVAVGPDGTVYGASGTQIDTFPPVAKPVPDLPAGYIGGSSEARSTWPVLCQGGLAVNAAGVIYVLEGTGPERVLKLNTNGVLQTWGGAGTNDGQFSSPQMDIRLDSQGNVYVLEQNGVQKFDADGNFLLSWGRPGMASERVTPTRVAVHPEGGIYVTDFEGTRILNFSAGGQFVRQLKFAGGTSENLGHPRDIFVTKAGQVVVSIGHYSGYQIHTYDQDLQETAAPWTSDKMVIAGSVVLDSHGNTYEVDYADGYLRKFSPGKALLKTWKLTRPNGSRATVGAVTVDKNDFLYVTLSDGTFRKLTTNGTVVLKWGTAGPSSVVQHKYDIEVDASGNIYVADTDRHRIQKYSRTGQLLSTWGKQGRQDGEFSYPTGLALGTNGDVYVADLGNTRLQVFSFSGGGAPQVTGWKSRAEVVEEMTVVLGGSVVGAAPLQYQWYFENEPLVGATNANLSLIHLSLTNIGLYQLRVSNALGSILKEAYVSVLPWTNTTAVYQRHTDGRLALWPMAGTNVAGNFLLTPKAPAAAGWQQSLVGDLNGDHYPDVLLRHEDGRLRVYFYNRTNYLGGGALTKGSAASSGWSLRGISDLTGDGQNDLVWWHTDGRLTVWQMNGTNLVAKLPLAKRGFKPADGWSLAAVRDWDGDGDGDLLWRHTNGTLRWWVMNGTSYGYPVALNRHGPLAAAGNRLVAVPTGVDGKQNNLWWQNVNSQLLRQWEIATTDSDDFRETYLRNRQPLGAGWRVIGAE